MYRVIDVAVSDIDDGIRPFVGMVKKSHVALDLAEIQNLFTLGESFFDLIGVEIEPDETRENILRTVADHDNEPVVVVSSDRPDRLHQSIGRQSNDAVLRTGRKNMLQNLRLRLSEAMPGWVIAVLPPDRLVEEKFALDVHIVKLVVEDPGEAFTNGTLADAADTG